MNYCKSDVFTVTSLKNKIKKTLLSVCVCVCVSMCVSPRKLVYGEIINIFNIISIKNVCLWWPYCLSASKKYITPMTITKYL